MLEEQYLLKKHGGLSLFEQEQIVAEDRTWWYHRIKKDLDEEQERANRANQHRS